MSLSGTSPLFLRLYQLGINNVQSNKRTEPGKKPIHIIVIAAVILGLALFAQEPSHDEAVINIEVLVRVFKGSKTESLEKLKSKSKTKTAESATEPDI